MKLNEKRIVEYVLLILFPAALFAGCAGNGNEKPQTLSEYQADETQIERVSYAVESTIENESVQIAVINSDANDSVEVSAAPKPQAAVQEAHAGSLQSIMYFNTDNYTVRVEDESLLAQHASKLLSKPNAVLIIHGHADERGPEDYNLKLSELRAREVEDRLLSLGVADSQLRIQTYGESTPVESASNWQENRRVELEYTGAKDSKQIIGGLELGVMDGQIE